MDAIVNEIYMKDDSPEALRKLGVDTIEGRAQFVDSSTLSVQQVSLHPAADTLSWRQPPAQLVASPIACAPSHPARLPSSPLLQADTSIQVHAQQGIIIATGASVTRPPIEGLEQVEHLTYEEVFELDTLPDRMTVVGGGPIGCELSQAFARLGSKVRSRDE